MNGSTLRHRPRKILGRDGGRTSARPALVLVALLFAVLCACGSPSSSEGRAPAPAGPPTGASGWTAQPAPSAAEPSASAKQVCSPDDGQKDISAALGVTPTKVEPPTWQDHLYACRYSYPDGSFALSVKELAGDQQAATYLDQLAGKLGNLAPLDGIGEAAFYTRNGSIVARKDDKVLLVDVAGLPTKFGNPPAPPASVSRIIATVIMGCWSGA